MIKKKFAGNRLGYYPFAVLSHDTVDCIVTQQAWARKGWANVRPGLGHDTTEHAPQYGAQCGRYGPTHAQVAWLAESVAIQRLYCCLGQNLCHKRGSDTGCDTTQDAPRYGVVRARHGSRQGAVLRYKLVS